MQEGWGSGGDDANLGASQWEDEDGGVWNNTASQESPSSCSSWGNAPKKGLQKVRAAPGVGVGGVNAEPCAVLRWSLQLVTEGAEALRVP